MADAPLADNRTVPALVEQGWRSLRLRRRGRGRGDRRHGADRHRRRLLEQRREPREVLAQLLERLGAAQGGRGMEERVDAQRRAPSSCTCGRPCTLVIPRCERVSSFVAKLPSVQITFGSISSILRCRYGLHVSISSGCGSRLPGGRDWSTLVMKTSSRASPISSEQLVQQLPGPADERQALLVLVHAGRLAHEHQVGVRVARSEHHLGAALEERAALAAGCLPVQLDEVRAALLRAA